MHNKLQDKTPWLQGMAPAGAPYSNPRAISDPRRLWRQKAKCWSWLGQCLLSRPICRVSGGRHSKQRIGGADRAWLRWRLWMKSLCRRCARHTKAAGPPEYKCIKQILAYKTDISVSQKCIWTGYVASSSLNINNKNTNQ